MVDVEPKQTDALKGNDIWTALFKVKERASWIRGLILVVMFFAGATLNASYAFIDWIRLPFENKRDIVVLMEKSQEMSTMATTVNLLREEMQRLHQSDITIVGRIQKLEDGQLQLDLKVERLDERTKDRSIGMGR